MPLKKLRWKKSKDRYGNMVYIADTDVGQYRIAHDNPSPCQWSLRYAGDEYPDACSPVKYVLVEWAQIDYREKKEGK